MNEQTNESAQAGLGRLNKFMRFMERAIYDDGRCKCEASTLRLTKRSHKACMYTRIGIRMV